MELDFACIDSKTGEIIVSGHETAKPLLLLDAAAHNAICGGRSRLAGGDGLIKAIRSFFENRFAWSNRRMRCSDQPVFDRNFR